MSFWDRFRSKRTPAEAAPNPYRDPAVLRALAGGGRHRRRSFEMSKVDGLTSRWPTMTTSADANVRFALTALRSRARELEDNDPYAGRFLQAIDSNVVGDKGLIPVPEPPRVGNRTQIDAFAAKRIRDAWKRWVKKGVCTLCGRYSFKDLQKRILRSTAADGEIFIHLVVGGRAGNEFGFALEVLESELLDETYNDNLRNGNVIRMGVELNKNRRAVAYHFFKHNPYDLTFSSADGRRHERRRIPADLVIHCQYAPEQRPGQTRSVTWFKRVGKHVHQLHDYRQSEAGAARLGAAKAGFYVATGDGEFDGDSSEVTDDAFVQEIEPNTFEIVPEGYKVEKWDPDHPSTAFEAFDKSGVRTIASGLGLLFYPTLGADLQGTSYGSLRGGALEERAYYRELQQWLIQECGLEDKIYPMWLENAILHGEIRVAADQDIERLKVHRWQARGWQWIDPQKEAAGNAQGLANKTRLISDILAETSGRTIDDHIEALDAERKKFQSRGFEHPADAPAPGGEQPARPVEDGDDDEGLEEEGELGEEDDQ